MDKFKVTDHYMDVVSKLAKIALRDSLLMEQIIKEAMSATAQHFDMPYDEVNKLFGGPIIEYPESQVPIVVFYHEYLRKKLESHQ